MLVPILLLVSTPFANSGAGDYLPARCTSSSILNKTPFIQGPIHGGDTQVRIHDQVGNGTIDIFGISAGLLFSGSTKNSPAFALSVAATAGDAIYACQTGGAFFSTTRCSGLTTVRTAPATLEPPQLPHLVVTGGSAIGVAGIHPGAEVIVASNGVDIARRWSATDAVSIAIPSNLAAFTPLSVRQTLNGVTSGSRGTSNLPWNPSVAVPRIMEPIRAWDTAVWVSAITPGSRVRILDVATGAELGSKKVGEPIAKIPVCSMTGSIRAEVTRDGSVATSADVALGPEGTWTVGPEQDYDYGVDASTGLLMEGREYLPSITTNANPVVFLVHGNAPISCETPLFDSPSPTNESYLGYEYLAHELVELGFIVYSLRIPRNTLPDARADLLFATVDEVVARRADVDTQSPLGFFGQSLGGDAVVYARSVRGASLDLRGVVTVAPTVYALDYADFDPADGADVPLLHVFGNDDTFHTQGSSFQKSLRHYDNAWGAKSQLFIDGAGHNEFNTCWGTENPDGRLSMDEHQEILAAYTAPFFHALLTGSPETFAGYFEGTVRPRGMYHHSLTMQHHRGAGVDVIDTFGDVVTEHSFPNVNTDKLVNAQGGAVSQEVAPFASFGFLEDTHLGLASWAPTYAAVHDEDHRALLLEWDRRGHQYVSSLPTPIAVASDDYVSFRILAVPGAAPNDLNGQADHPTDLMVELYDGTFTAKVRAGSTGPVLYPFEDEFGTYRPVFRTVRIPIDAFTTVTPGFDLSSVQRVRIGGYMRETGLVIIDDLEITQ